RMQQRLASEQPPVFRSVDGGEAGQVTVDMHRVDHLPARDRREVRAPAAGEIAALDHVDLARLRHDAPRSTQYRPGPATGSVARPGSSNRHVSIGLIPRPPGHPPDEWLRWAEKMGLAMSHPRPAGGERV